MFISYVILWWSSCHTSPSWTFAASNLSFNYFTIFLQMLTQSLQRREQVLSKKMQLIKRGLIRVVEIRIICVILCQLSDKTLWKCTMMHGLFTWLLKREKKRKVDWFPEFQFAHFWWTIREAALSWERKHRITVL